MDDPLLLDLCIFCIPGLRIEALRSEHQHGLMALMVLSQGIVCGQYVATELAMCWNGGAGLCAPSIQPLQSLVLDVRMGIQ